MVRLIVPFKVYSCPLRFHVRKKVAQDLKSFIISVHSSHGWLSLLALEDNEVFLDSY